MRLSRLYHQHLYPKLMRLSRPGLMVITSYPSRLCITLTEGLDDPKVTAGVKELLDSIPDALTRARLLAASGKESGARLEALPISSLGLRIDDNTVRIAVGLMLEPPLFRPHHCQFCGSEVGCEDIHGLSCRSSWSSSPFRSK